MDRNLHAFLVVAETLNITAAAEQLNITQPTLTKRLKQLEYQYDVQLLERLPRGVRLTKFGEKLLPFVQQIKYEHVQANEAIQSVKSGQLDTLNVGAGPLFMLRYLSEAFENIYSEFPHTSLNLFANLNSVTLPMLREGLLDIVFGTYEHLDENDQIEFRQLTVVEQGVILSAQNQHARSDFVDFSDLHDIPWIVYKVIPENENQIRSLFSAQGFSPPKIAIRTTSLLLGFQMVANGNFVMMLPLLVNPILDATKLKMLRIKPTTGAKKAGAYVRKSSDGFPIINRLIENVTVAANRDSYIATPDNQIGSHCD